MCEKTDDGRCVILTIHVRACGLNCAIGSGASI